MKLPTRDKALFLVIYKKTSIMGGTLIQHYTEVVVRFLAQFVDLSLPSPSAN